jgi:hypothetical protein
MIVPVIRIVMAAGMKMACAVGMLMFNPPNLHSPLDESLRPSQSQTDSTRT